MYERRKESYRKRRRKRIRKKERRETKVEGVEGEK